MVPQPLLQALSLQVVERLAKKPDQCFESFKKVSPAQSMELLTVVFLHERFGGYEAS